MGGPECETCFHVRSTSANANSTARQLGYGMLHDEDSEWVLMNIIEDGNASAPVEESPHIVEEYTVYEANETSSTVFTAALIRSSNNSEGRTLTISRETTLNSVAVSPALLRGAWAPPGHVRCRGRFQRSRRVCRRFCRFHWLQQRRICHRECRCVGR